MATPNPTSGIYLLDYGAGNVLSVVNAVKSLGADLTVISDPEQIPLASKLIFPGVGSFGACVKALESKGFVGPLKAYIESGKPLFGICLGMQLLFEESEESPGVKGLGIIPGKIKKFIPERVPSIPHIGWNGIKIAKNSSVLTPDFDDSFFYFVHSFRAIPDKTFEDWILTTTNFGDEEFVSSVEKENVTATQFHPEKSSHNGLRLLKQFLFGEKAPGTLGEFKKQEKPTQLSKRIIACLDVRANDQGDLVVTKGDQYDVRQEGNVRNLGKPVELAHRYFEEGADEVTFLNITSFRNCPMKDMPMLEVLRRASEKVFVPLTIGGGIRDMKDSDGKVFSALDVASEYFRSGADKVSIGSDAVYAVEEYLANGGKKSGLSCIEQIAYVYGSQAVVISVDPKRVYIANPADTTHRVITLSTPGPNGEKYCWYQCTVMGGRETRDIDVHQLVTVCENLGAGEILLNCIDKDGTNSGFDIDLVRDVKSAVKIPVIASSGAGKPEHFSEVFEATGVESALAAGIFHRREVPVEDVKKHLREKGIVIRS